MEPYNVYRALCDLSDWGVDKLFSVNLNYVHSALTVRSGIKSQYCFGTDRNVSVPLKKLTKNWYGIPGELFRHIYLFIF